MATQQEKAARFRALHEGDPFLIPNPWDTGSARVMQALGFEALATTSSGFAFTLGRSDGNVTLDELAAHVSALAEATSVPLAVDLENGFGPEPEDAARAIVTAAEAGAVGGSIEDWDPAGHIYEPAHAAMRVAAAVAAARELDFPFTLTARAENHVHDIHDLDDTIARLRSFEQAGADVLFAPGLRGGDDIRAVCEAAGQAGQRARPPRPQHARGDRGGRAAHQRGRRAHLGGGGGDGGRGRADPRERRLRCVALRRARGTLARRLSAYSRSRRPSRAAASAKRAPIQTSISPRAAAGATRSTPSSPI